MPKIVGSRPPWIRPRITIYIPVVRRDLVAEYVTMAASLYVLFMLFLLVSGDSGKNFHV